MSTTGAPNGIDVRADLTLSSPEATAHVSTDAARIDLSLSSARGGIAAWRRLSPGRRSSLLRTLGVLVESTGRTLTVEVESQTIAHLSPGARSGKVERVFGLSPLKVHWLALVRALLRRAPAREGPLVE